MPKECKLKLFRVRVSPHQTDRLLTNEVEPVDMVAADHENSVCWTIEPFYANSSNSPAYRSANAG